MTRLEISTLEIARLEMSDLEMKSFREFGMALLGHRKERLPKLSGIVKKIFK